ncbi:MAG: hypothetical protein ACJAYC_003434 [Halieaceae bacterium]
MLSTPGLINASWFALACALMINVRIMGVMIPLVILPALLVPVLQARLSWLKWMKMVLVSVVLMPLLVVLMWPCLWGSPVTRFIEAFKNMSRFRWAGTVLYMGEYVRATDLPLHCACVWIFITTPLTYSLLFVTGCVSIVLRSGRWDALKRLSDGDLQDLAYLACSIGTVLIVVALNSVLYDSPVINPNLILDGT